jgi:hypothetical protein
MALYAKSKLAICVDKIAMMYSPLNIPVGSYCDDRPENAEHVIMKHVQQSTTTITTVQAVGLTRPSDLHSKAPN